MAAFIEDSFVNAAGHRIRTYSILPQDTPRAVLVLAHGYGHTAQAQGFYFTEVPQRSGLALYTMDHHGHGHSEGLRAFVQDFRDYVRDFGRYVREVSAKHPGLPVFILGESMGGAIVLLSAFEGGDLHGFVRGVIMVAPMCKVADSVRPPDWQIKVLTWIAGVGPTWAITPVPDLSRFVFKDPKKTQEYISDPMVYHGKPRLRTAVELHKTTEFIEQNLAKVAFPFLVLHGKADTVTDPAISQELYDKAASQDKTIKLYEGAFHGLFAEPDDGGKRVLEDVLEWINARI